MTEFNPVSVQTLTTGKDNTSHRPLQVWLQSAIAKRHFLQARRSKKDIFPADIGLTQHSRKQVLITEQLTRPNQELMYQARSLRGSGGYKFVWSNNGQILVRKQQNSRVIRILNEQHINQLKRDLQFETHNGTSHSSESVINDANRT